MDYKVICPKNPSHKEFSTTAHVTQEWKVDERGDYIEEIDACSEVNHEPDDESTYSCLICGADALVVHGPFLEDARQELKDWEDQKKLVFLQALIEEFSVFLYSEEVPALRVEMDSGTLTHDGDSLILRPLAEEENEWKKAMDVVAELIPEALEKVRAVPEASDVEEQELRLIEASRLLALDP
jgi:virulence-associated protein VagC